MNNRKTPHPLLWLTVIFITLFSLLGYTTALASKYPELSARAAALYQPDTGEFLYRKSSRLRLPMASTTKLMTALVVSSLASPSDTVTVTAESVGIEGSSAYLREGELLSVEELLYALLLQSANDAATALAIHISGSVEAFAALMNEEAERLSLSDTHFTNPHGLDDPDHYTTAEDLSFIAARVLQVPYLKNIVSTYKKTFSNGNTRRTYINHNKLLLRYDGAVGMKTGYTKKCGRCLVGAAERDGLTFITVTLDAPSDWSDHARLFDYGFETLERVTLCDALEFAYDIPVVSGERELVRLKNTEGLSVILPKGEHRIESTVSIHRYAVAPISKGTALGQVSFTVDGKVVGSVSLVAEESIPEIRKKSFLDSILDKIF